jgi:hypothetical protein
MGLSGSYARRRNPLLWTSDARRRAPDTPGEWEITVEAISKAEAEATELSRYDPAEADEESTDLSDAPQDVKEQSSKMPKHS